MTRHALRSLDYAVQRYILRRAFLNAKADVFDLRLKVKTEDVLGRHVFKYGMHELGTTRYLMDTLQLPEGSVVLDVGANVGWLSLVLDRVAPDGVDVFAFEPDPTNFELLVHNLEANRATKVTPLQLGVSDATGTATLYLAASKNLGAHSMIKRRHDREVEIAVTTLADFWRERELGDRPLALLKMDIEGYELAALRGAGELVGRAHALLLEYSPRYMRDGGLEPGAMLDLVAGFGHAPHEISDEGTLTPVDLEPYRTTDRHCNLVWT